MFGLYNSSALPMLLVIDVDFVVDSLCPIWQPRKNANKPCTRWLVLTVSDSMALRLQLSHLMY